VAITPSATCFSRLPSTFGDHGADVPIDLTTGVPDHIQVRSRIDVEHAVDVIGPATEQLGVFIRCSEQLADHRDRVRGAQLTNRFTVASVERWSQQRLERGLHVWPQPVGGAWSEGS